jgi:hypothetical protein
MSPSGRELLRDTLDKADYLLRIGRPAATLDALEIRYLDQIIRELKHSCLLDRPLHRRRLAGGLARQWPPPRRGNPAASWDNAL